MSANEPATNSGRTSGSKKRVLTLVLLMAALGLVYLSATHHDLFAAFSQSTDGGREVLYWYDAMNPQHHYDKPGKAPDGMDLLPAYADQAGPSSSVPGSSSTVTDQR